MPTSLIYIALSTRGCSPWRPDAVMSTTGGENKSRPSDFQGSSRAHADGAKTAPLSRPANPIAGQADSRVCRRALTRKDNSRRGSRRRLRLRLCCHPLSTSRCGNLNPLPFRLRRTRERPHFRTNFFYLLGSTNPCPIAVHMEPFPTSVFKVLI